jgi:hypothetical protein
VNNSKGLQRIQALEGYIRQFEGQESELEQFAYMGVRLEISQSIAYLMKNKPDETDLLERLQSLYANSRGPLGGIDSSLANFRKILDDCAGRTTPKTYFARYFTLLQLSTMKHWIEVCKKSERANEVQLSALHEITEMISRYRVNKHESAPAPGL